MPAVGFTVTLQFLPAAHGSLRDARVSGEAPRDRQPTSGFDQASFGFSVSAIPGRSVALRNRGSQAPPRVRDSVAGSRPQPPADGLVYRLAQRHAAWGDAMSTEDHEYSYGLATATLLMACVLTDAEKTPDRQATKQRIVDKKRELLLESFRDNLTASRRRRDGDRPLAPQDLTVSLLELALHKVAGQWDVDMRRRLLIDLALADPYSPYEVKASGSDFKDSLIAVSRALGLPVKAATEVLEVRAEAVKAHRALPWKKIAASGAIGTVILASGAWILAPAIGTALGTAAGLSGAAATAHGLALLGGGSLAAGGAGMAGGLWIVTGVGAAVGVTAGGAGQALKELGAAQVRVELIKLQMSYKLDVIHGQAHIHKARSVIAELDKSRAELEQALAEERLLNDRNAARVRDIEEILEALDHAKQFVAESEAA